MAQRSTITVVLPTFNEADNIIELIAQIEQHLDGYPLTILVVDDNSPDGTGQLVQSRIDGGDSRLHLHTRTDRRGLATAISDGIALATTDIVAWMDCDFSMPPSLLPTLVARVEEGYDLAVGSRYVRGGSDARGAPLRAWTSKLISILSNRLLVRDFYDYTSGFAAMRVASARKVPFKGSHGEYFIELVYRASKQGMRIIEIPYDNVQRVHGVSKTETGFIANGLKYIKILARLKLGRG